MSADALKSEGAGSLNHSMGFDSVGAIPEGALLTALGASI